MTADGDQLRCNAPRGALTEELRRELAACKAGLLALLRNGAAAARSRPMATIAPADRSRPLPLSFAQQRVWFLEQLLPGTPLYNVAFAVHFDGRLEVAALRQALAGVIERHEILRTAFEVHAGKPAQRVLTVEQARAALPDGGLREVDVRDLPAAERDAEVRRLADHEARRPFDLAAAPLLRCVLVTSADDRHTLVIAVHHLVFDGWSMDVFMREVVGTYLALTGGAPATLEPLAVQYADYAAWQQGWIAGEAARADLAYWVRRMAGLTQATTLATDRPRPSVPTSEGAVLPFEVPAAVSRQVRDLAADLHSTPFAVLLSVFALQLRRYSGSPDVVLATPVAARSLPAFEPLVGFFVNMLALRCDLSGGRSFADLVKRVTRQLADDLSHQDLPAEKLAEALRLQRDPTQPLVPISFALEHAPRPVELPGLAVRGEGLATGTAKNDLTLLMYADNGTLRGVVEYSTTLYDASTAAGVAEDFQALLAAATATPNRNVDELAAGIPPRPQRTRPDAGRLTPCQQVVWAGQELYPDLPLYNIGALARIHGPVDAGAFWDAFATVVRDSDALRTVIERTPDGPRQRVLEACGFAAEVVDLSRAADPEQALEAWWRERLVRPFDLAVRLFDVVLLRLGPAEFAAYFAVHHLVHDAFSPLQALEETSRRYGLSLAGRLGEAEPIPSFTDYRLEHAAYLASDEYQADLAWWREKVPTPAEPLDLYGRVAKGFAPKVTRVTRVLDDARSQRVRDLAKRLKAAEPQFFTALFAVFLHRASGVQQVSLGMPVHNRRNATLKRMIGQTMEVLPLRLSVEPETTLATLCATLRREAMAAMRHGRVTLGNPVHRRLYNAFVSYLPQTEGRFHTWPAEPRWLHSGYDENDIALQIHDFFGSGRFVLDLDFRDDLFDAETRERAADHLLALLDDVLADPDRPAGRYSLLSPAERSQVVEGFNATARPYRVGTLVELFEEQVARTPEAEALRFAGQALSYAAFNARTNRLAGELIARGVGPDDLVGVLADRSLEMMVAIYAILKAGGAYVPIAPDYPRLRIEQILEDARPRLVLTQSAFAGRVQGVPTLAVDDERPWAERSPDNPPRRVGPQHAAYVIFTSGSTGRPKGVLVEHGAIVNRLLWMQEAFKLTPDDRVLQKTPLTFDVSVWELFWPLQTGSTLVIAIPGGHKDADYLATTIQSEAITTLHFVPSMLRAFLEAGDLETRCRPVRRVICSGEALTADLVTRFHQRLTSELHNLYGPTEAAVDVSHYACSKGAIPNVIPIGKPIANTQLYVLDAALQPLPVGVAGELYIGGVQVARGYVNRPELTAERFVPDPFNPNGRLYRTGDLARWQADGNVEFLGRLDDQVKVRGFRIELGEIEAALGSHSGVKHCAVLARDDGRGSTRLVAYYVAADGRVTDSDLRRHLQERLAEYMVPGVYVSLAELPLNSSGKVDRKALPAPPAVDGESRAGYVAPRTPTEQALAAIFAEVLGVARPGIHDNFFDLGGHSLAAVQLVSEVERRLGRKIRLAEVFHTPTIAYVAELLDRAPQPAASGPLVLLAAGGALPPLYCVHTTFGGALCFVELARRVGGERAVYGVQSVGMAGDEPALATIEAMADRYLREILARQPEGPYHLLGYSMGGSIVLEMARRLRRDGRTVGVLVVVDAPVRHGRYEQRQQAMSADQLVAQVLLDTGGAFSRNFPELAPDRLMALPEAERVPTILSALRRGGYVPDSVDVRQPQRYLDVINHNAKACVVYDPPAFDGSLDLLLAADEPRPAGHDFAADWSDLVRGGVRVLRLPGTHDNLLMPPQVERVAGLLRGWLAGGAEPAARA